MNIVPNVSRLGDLVQTFTGKDVDQAIQSAEEWAERTGNILAGNYYPQTFPSKGSKSIIVDVKPIKESNDPPGN